MRTVLLIVCLLPVLTVKTNPTPAGSDELVVSLENGRIRGEYVTAKGTERRVKQYLGIPYARPPVGPLRLAAPQSAEPWEGERDCTRQPPICIQDPDLIVKISRLVSADYTPPEMSEDCLYLNVYAPAGAATTDKLPVMVWIHDAGVMFGAASQFDGAPLVAYENIVLVVIQFRIGILGFLSTGDEHARGNWGLLDQLAALRWVQENIKAFGGDPQTVTIAGESAGGISASILTVSPQAKGLFQRAIFQSGVTLSTYTSEHHLAHAKIVASLTGCNISNTEQMVQCLKGKNTDELVSATKKVKFLLGAAVDGDFLPGTPEDLLKRKEVPKVPVMMGITNHEFGWIIPQSFLPPGWEKGMNRETMLTVLNIFHPVGFPVANSVIVDEYLKDAKTPEDIRDGFTEMMGDMLIMMSVVREAGYHTDAGAPVYMYEFVYRDIHRTNRPSFVKADHGDDVGFMFGGCFFNGHIKVIGDITSEHEGVCRTMMSYWGSFVRTGSPNGPGLVSWPQYDRQKQEYMELGLTQTVKQKLKEDRVQFFTVTLFQRLAQLAAAAN